MNTTLLLAVKGRQNPTIGNRRARADRTEGARSERCWRAGVTSRHPHLNKASRRMGWLNERLSYWLGITRWWLGKLLSYWPEMAELLAEDN